MFFMGIDIGTQGVRTIISNERGHIIAAKSIAFECINISKEEGVYEQNPATWWNSLVQSVSFCTSEMKNSGHSLNDLCSICVDGTSGTILAVDKNGNPLCNAMMYNDMRAADEVSIIRSFAGDFESKLGLRFNPSFALPRILWLKNNKPDIYESAYKIIHQTDYIVGRLCGEFGISDYSNSLKTGYDLLSEQWPSFLYELGIDQEKLPRIVAPGQKIAQISTSISKELGLPSHAIIVAGATDGYASALAAGACRVGDWASIIGTTLVLKGVSDKIVIDPTGASYSHKLPTGNWLTGGASNVGGRCLINRFDKNSFSELDTLAEALAPTGVLIYPLTGIGERYPFVDPNASEFIVGDSSDPITLYTALMEGVGYTERLAFDLNCEMGLPVGDIIYTSGGACKSDIWLQIRASILGRTLKIPVVVDAAMGTALIAASNSYFKDLPEAASEMINFSKTVEPDPHKTEIYAEHYKNFRKECLKRFDLNR